MKKNIKLLTFSILFISTLLFLYIIGINKPNYYIKGNEAIKEISIESGDSVNDISIFLYKNGLINSRALFRLYVYLNKKPLQAGIFELSTNLNIKQLTELLGKGDFQRKFTFIEGLRIEQMAELLDEKIQDGFLQSTYTKEGFMFPDTYFFLEDASGEEIAKTLKETFEEKIKPLQPKIESGNLSINEIVTLASIVEREANKTEDREIVAGILIKRYEKGWPLQADATIQYAKDNMTNIWWGKLTARDLAIESPYNTYKYKGLPPTPICNPGLEAIKAVLNPKETEYWFYLTDNNGITHYSITIEEHNEKIREYL